MKWGILLTYFHPKVDWRYLCVQVEFIPVLTTFPLLIGHWVWSPLEKAHLTKGDPLCATLWDVAPSPVNYGNHAPGCASSCLSRQGLSEQASSGMQWSPGGRRPSRPLVGRAGWSNPAVSFLCTQRKCSLLGLESQLVSWEQWQLGGTQLSAADGQSALQAWPGGCPGSASHHWGPSVLPLFLPASLHGPLFTAPHPWSRGTEREVIARRRSVGKGRFPLRACRLPRHHWLQQGWEWVPLPSHVAW